MSIDYDAVAYVGIDLSYDAISDMVAKYTGYDEWESDSTSYFMDDFYENVWNWNMYVDDNNDDSYSIGVELRSSVPMGEVNKDIINAENEYWRILSKMFPAMPDEEKSKMIPHFGVKLRTW